MSRFICDERTTVGTKYGRLMGFALDSTYIFRGIRYAKARRFERPEEVEPWEGVQKALHYGPICKTAFVETHASDIMIPHREWIQSEDCQYLNVWTQSLDPQEKLPVMVWIHGGGYTMGSSLELEALDGERLSRYGKVVVVSLNHRLNILGYLDLKEHTDRFPDSANAGTEDLVAALRWIRDNIAAFGGDPDNVTIFGQSGGGHKVASLLQIPEADGLFHKCIMMSGITANFRYPHRGENGKQIVDALLKELGLKASEADKLAEVPFERLSPAYGRVQADLRKQWVYCGETPLPDDFFPGDWIEIGFRPETRNIPVMVGTVIGEFAFDVWLPDKHRMTEAEQMAALKDKFGDAAEVLVPLFREAYPNHPVADLMYLESSIRREGQRFCRARAAMSAAPVYNYVFSQEFPIDGGRLAWHCADIPFAFHNVDLVPVANMGEDSEALQENMCGAWVSFARNGKPVLPAGPEWKPFTAENCETMIFDTPCRLGIRFDNELLEKHAAVVLELVMQA